MINVPRGWWIFRWEGRRPEVHSRLEEGWRWGDRRWCLCMRASPGVLIYHYTHTRWGNVYWVKSRLNLKPTGGPGSDDRKDWSEQNPWKPDVVACNILRSILLCASWIQLKYLLSQTHKSIQSACICTQNKITWRLLFFRWPCITRIGS